MFTKVIVLCAAIAFTSAGYAPAAVAPAAVSYSSNLAVHPSPLTYSRLAAVPSVAAVNPLAYNSALINPYSVAPLSAYSAFPAAAYSPYAAAPYSAFPAAAYSPYSAPLLARSAYNGALVRSAYGGLVY